MRRGSSYISERRGRSIDDLETFPNFYHATIPRNRAGAAIAGCKRVAIRE